MNPTILVVDDDTSVIASLALLLKQAGFRHLSAPDPHAALSALDSNSVDLVIQDMNFARATSGEQGMELLCSIRQKHPRLPVVLLTAWGTIPLAVEGMKAGAADFVTKPWDNTHLLQVIRTALSLAEPREIHGDRESLDSTYGFKQIVGTHPTILKLLSQLGRVARTDATVLITGETGTGKELLADAIHLNSSRAPQPFVKVNMGAVVASLFDSEMFGHVRGAFTDAKSDRSGYFEQAHRGTIFLDEVGELDVPSQIKLLRVLQEREFRRVGSSEVRRADFRVIAATNRDLGRLVALGMFREDLYYRLNLITFQVPPLRSRASDIPLIAKAYLRELAARYDMQDVRCDEDVFEWIKNQPWPGNVRQLKHTLERALLLSGSSKLSRVDVIEASTQAGEMAATEESTPEGLDLDHLERTAITKAMQRADHNVSRAADMLGLTRAALYRRLAKYRLLRE
jgi:two-component system, NtrC family, response regulator